jgi:aminopeptidase YwaD
MRKCVMLVIFAVVCNVGLGQLEEARRITKELCSETYFGRGYIKGGDSLAALFLEKEFKKRGLKKSGKSYLQPFYLDVNTFPGKMEVAIGDRKLVPGKDFMVDPASGSISGKMDPQVLTAEQILDSGLKKQLASWTSERRANGVLIDKRGWTGDSLKKLQLQLGQLAQLCPVWVVTDEKFTFSVSDVQYPQALVYIQGTAYVAGGTLTADIAAVLRKDHRSNNVIAMLPARKKTKKTLFFTAHYDHLGGMGDQTYFPGGNDNASGTSMLFTLADYFLKNPINYNIVFIAFAGEEAGLVGSHHYIEHPTVNLKDIRFLLNLDIMGSGEEGITVVNATLFPKEFETLLSLNEANKYLALIKKRGEAANSDHYWFTKAGVPAFFIYTMGGNKHYHDVFDTYEELTFNEYEDITKLIAGFVKTL